MPELRIAPQVKLSLSIAIKIRLARVLAMPETELEKMARGIETDPLFRRLTTTGVLAISEFPAARFGARRFAGHGLRVSGSGLPELVDGNCDLARLMQSLGQQRFEKWFLGGGPCSDQERARGCGISVAEARKLREFMDRAFIQGEFEGSTPAAAAPEKVFGTVARIAIEDGQPVLSFFHRDVWQKRYRVDKGRLVKYLAAMPRTEAGKVKELLSRLEVVERRKTTLYRLLGEVLRIQAEYLRSGDPALRQALTQRALAAKLRAAPSAINQLISNKSVQMPWGLEAPLAIFFPSAKEINRERLYDLASTERELTDEGLRDGMERLHGVRLSRRSIAQYRKELALGGRNRRT